MRILTTSVAVRRNLLLWVLVKRVSVGKFYFTYHPLNYYYCDRIQGDKVYWHLIESFQNGEKVTVALTQNIRYSTRYIPVSDKKILNRLKGRLEEYLQRSAKKT